MMSRTNQEYRNFLIAADSVWKQSRLRLGMPDLTAKDITERQYILLMFDKTCHGTVCTFGALCIHDSMVTFGRIALNSTSKTWRGSAVRGSAFRADVRRAYSFLATLLSSIYVHISKMTKGKLRRYIATLHPYAQVCAKGPDDLGMQKTMQRFFFR